MIKELKFLADSLDLAGQIKLANKVDQIIIKASGVDIDIDKDIDADFEESKKSVLEKICQNRKTIFDFENIFKTFKEDRERARDKLVQIRDIRNENISLMKEYNKENPNNKIKPMDIYLACNVKYK